MVQRKTRAETSTASLLSCDEDPWSRIAVEIDI
jgi:hypothetical protein